MPKHTPGPWEWCETETGIYGDVRRFQHKGIDHINQVQVYPFYDSDRTNGMHGQRHEADKRLIAAAPDLLEALIEMEEMFAAKINGSIGPDDAAERWDRARAAIAKATAE